MNTSKQAAYNEKRKQERILFWQNYDEAIKRIDAKIKDVSIKTLKGKPVIISFAKVRRSKKTIADVMAENRPNVYARLDKGRPQ